MPKESSQRTRRVLRSLRTKVAGWFRPRFKERVARKKGFLHLDFKRKFPHTFWMSTIVKDAKSPRGFRIKALLRRCEINTYHTDQYFELIIVREEHAGDQTKLLLTHINPKDVAEVLHAITERDSIIFRSFDLSRIRTLEEFKIAAREIRWNNFETDIAARSIPKMILPK